MLDSRFGIDLRWLRSSWDIFFRKVGRLAFGVGGHVGQVWAGFLGLVEML